MLNHRLAGSYPECTPENIESFIVNVRNGREGDQRGGVLEEVVNTQQLASARCSRCTTPLMQLFTVKMESQFQDEKCFMPSYDVAELTEYHAAQATGVALPSPLPEWVPQPKRKALVTDLDKVQWDRKNYIPFESVPELVRDARVLVAPNENPSIPAHGALVYIAENRALIQLDEKRTSQREAPLVIYPLNYPGLYLDGESSAHYQMLCALRDVHHFQFTFSLLSDVERQEQAPVPYTWKFTIVGPDSLHLNGVADTYRAALSEAYLTLCRQGYIDDPFVEKADGCADPF
jgi:hypothetical protein